MYKASREDLARQTEYLRQAALEFRERLRKKDMSIDSVWNAAVYECMDLFGPVCGSWCPQEGCQKCWIHGKLRGALRLDASSYVPLKERMNKSLERLRKTCTLKGPECESYVQALEDVATEMNGFMEDFE